MAATLGVVSVNFLFLDFSALSNRSVTGSLEAIAFLNSSCLQGDTASVTKVRDEGVKAHGGRILFWCVSLNSSVELRALSASVDF